MTDRVQRYRGYRVYRVYRVYRGCRGCRGYRVYRVVVGSREASAEHVPEGWLPQAQKARGE